MRGVPDEFEPVQRLATVSDVQHGARALARNSMLNLVGQGLPLVAALFLLPPLIDALGEARFGTLAIAWVILGYFTDLGAGRATTKYAAELLAEERQEHLPSVVWTTAAIQLGFGIVGAGLLALATPLLVERVLEIPPELIRETRTGFYVIAAAVPIVLLSSVFRGVVEAAQRFDLVNAVRIPTSLANYALPLAAVPLGWGLPGVVLLLVLARAASICVFWRIAVRLFPPLRHPAFHAAEFRKLAEFGSWVTISTIVSPVIAYVDRFMLGALVSMAAVAYYTAPFELVARAWIVPAALVATLFPAFSALSSRQDWERVEQLSVRGTKYILFLVGPAMVLIALAAGDLLRVWLGETFAAQSALALRILALGVLINSLAHVPSALCQGLGRPDLPAKFHLLELPVQLVLAWFCVRQWGVTGAAVAWTARVTLDALLLFGAAARLAPISVKSLFRERIPHAVALLAAALAIGGLTVSRLPQLWVRGVFDVALGLVLAALVWRVLLRDGERQQLLRFLRPAVAQ